MTSENADGWAVVVPAMEPVVADALWQQWLALHGSNLAPEEILVDLIHATGGEQRRYRVKGLQLLSSHDFGETLSARCPTARSIVAAHLEQWDGEILMTLLVSDLRRHLETVFETGEQSETCGCLETLDLGICNGDASVQNAIGVSFVEEACWWEESRQAFIATWPAALQSEVERQRSRPSRPASEHGL